MTYLQKKNIIKDDFILNLEKITCLKFKNIELIKSAFVHRSYLNESKRFIKSNETLEFLGDSILSFVVSLYLFVNYADKNEGDLTNIRSNLVNTQSLAEVALKIKLNDIVYLSKGEEKSGGRTNRSIMADTMEAFIGAVYLDLGLEEATNLIKKYILCQVDDLLKSNNIKDAKSIFQEIIQDKYRISPFYKILSEKGPDHAKIFTVGVYVKDTLRGTGSGANKQRAEETAAKDALEKLNNIEYN